MIFALSDIKSQFVAVSFNKGLEYFTNGCVSSPNVQADGKLITAIIQQSNKRLRIYIRTEKVKGNTVFNGECSCVTRKNCAHVAAVLLQALDDQQLIPNSGNAKKTVQKRKSLSRALSGTRSMSLATKQAIVYILYSDSKQALIEPFVALRIKPDHYSIKHYFEPVGITGRLPARFMTASDVELLDALNGCARSKDTGIPVLKGDQSAALLEQIISTGRCFYDDPETGTPLLSGSKRALTFSWNVDVYGYQRLKEHVIPAAKALLMLSSPWYLDVEKHECGSLSGDLDNSTIKELIKLPSIAPEQAAEMQNKLMHAWPEAYLPPLKIFEVLHAPAVKPVPCLRITTIEEEIGNNYKDYTDFAGLSFYYGDSEVSPRTPSTLIKDDQLIILQRDKQSEKNAVKQLQKFGFREDKEWSQETGKCCFFPASNILGNEVEAWLDFQQECVPALLSAGWKIEYDDFRYHLLEPENWFCEVEKLQKQDWFSIGLGVEVDGQRIELLPILLEFLNQLPAGGLPNKDEIVAESFILPYSNNEDEEFLLRLPVSRVLPMLEMLLEVYGSRTLLDKKHLHFNRLELARLTALDQAADGPGLQWLADDDLQQLIKQLSDLDCIPEVAAPQSLKATLRPYQQLGLNWLQFLREFKLAGILADDMGLGKTVQALAHLLIEKESGRCDRPSLIIAPTSLMFNWRQEAQRFAPELSVLVLHGPKRKERYKDIDSHDIILSTYPLLVRDKNVLLAHQYHLLILDEAQVIKNPGAQASRVAREINARHRLCMTGTPLENHLGELWSLFDFLLPGLLGNKKQFRQFFRTPIEKHADEASLERLSSRIRPFLLRRSKDQVLTELPPKTEITQTVLLEGKQRELYETVRLAMHKRVREEIERKGMARSHITVLDALLKLRQVCCHPALVKMDQAKNVKHSAKLAMLMDLLPEMLEEGRRILLFSQFTTMLGLIEDELKSVNIKYVKLTGKSRDRETPVQQFQRGEVPLFLISLKAGGVGLNLTAADTVIHYDPWWNPAVERQATDRAHRIGQQQKLFVYKLICKGTVEEKIQIMQQSKQNLADNIYRKGASEPQWSEQDFQALFSPQDEI